MKISDILNFWKEQVPEGWEHTCDRLHYGDPEKEAGKIAVCFKITHANLTEALAWGADLLITHEPLYPRYDGKMPPEETVPVVRRMHERLTEAGVGVFRLHDHAHLYKDDFIHLGFLRKTGLEVRTAHPPIRLGFRQYELTRPYTAAEIARITRERLGIAQPRIAGCTDVPLTRVVLALGGIGEIGYDVLTSSDTELLITGEIGELGSAFYANEAAAAGETKAFLVLGHCESERYGMEALADCFAGKCPSAEIRYFDTDVTYRYV